MTKNLRSLVLLTSCLALSACAGDKHHDAPRAVEPGVQQARPESAAVAEPSKLDLTTLTATAPLVPKSIGDDPPPPKKREQPVAEVDFAHDAEPESPTDYDRPLTVDEVKVERFVLATGVEQREPVGETTLFTSDTKRIFAFVELANETEPYTVEVHFEKVDGPRSLYGVKLPVNKAARFRTWAWTQIRREPGLYRAVLRTPAGEEIGSREFSIIEPVVD